MLTIKNWNKKRKWGYKKYHQLQCRCGRRMRIYWEKKEIEWFARWCQQCVDPFDLLANIAINGAYEFWLLLWNCIVVCTGLFIVKVALFCKCSWHHPIALAKWKSLHHTMLQKLSKCEVKAWLCWNLMILPPLRFYLKSNFSKFKQSKNVFWQL